MKSKKRGQLLDSVIRKSLKDLKEKDFEKHLVWYVFDRVEEKAYPTDLTIVPMEDEPYIVKSIYTLNDGSEYYGFFYIYDHTGFVIFLNCGQVYISDYKSCNYDRAKEISLKFGKNINSIFPIKYQPIVKIKGTSSKEDNRIVVEMRK